MRRMVLVLLVGLALLSGCKDGSEDSVEATPGPVVTEVAEPQIPNDYEAESLAQMSEQEAFVGAMLAASDFSYDREKPYEWVTHDGYIDLVANIRFDGCNRDTQMMAITVDDRLELTPLNEIDGFVPIYEPPTDPKVLQALCAAG